MKQQQTENLQIYLDNNASTYLDPQVKDVILQHLDILGANPSSSHQQGKKIRSLVSKARDIIAKYLGVSSQEIIFTSGGTEGANLAIHGLLPEKGCHHIISSSAEHSSVFHTLELLEKQGHLIQFLKPTLYGAPTPQAVENAILPSTKLIALMAVNNETGVKTDIKVIGEIALEHNIPFFVDGVALLGKEFVRIPPGVAMMSFSAHKCHAPQGIGFCFLRKGTKCRPLFTGGEHEYGKRAGTENVLGIIALGKAIEVLSQEIHEASKRMERLRNYFEEKLLVFLHNVSINGQGPRVANVSNIAFEGVDGETLLIELDRHGIQASHGSACASGSLEPSRVLLQMGIKDSLVKSSIRFSLSRFTTEEEIEKAIEIIKSLVKPRSGSSRWQINARS